MQTEALIIGGGIAGQTLAALLGGAGMDVCLVESADPARKPAAPSARTVAVMQASLNVLRQAGIWNRIADDCTPLKTMRIVDDSAPGTDPVTLSFASNEIDLPAFGYNIPDAMLRDALLSHLETIKNIRTIAPAKLASYKTDGAQVHATLDTGDIITASIIIGTDGRNSVTRRIAGIDVDEHDYKQTAMTCLLNHTRPHDFISTEFHRPGGPFTFVPMPGNQCSLVWVENTDDAAQFLSLKRDAFEKAIQDRSHNMLGKITLASTPESWPLKLLKSKRLTAPRCAIAAESAHVISPIGAQGLNLSLRDIAALAETLIDAARLGEDIGAPLVLDRYESRRRIDIGTRVAGVDGFNRIVSNDVAFLRGLRRAGLKSLGAIPPLRALAMHQGLAPMMDAGRILNGEAL